MPAPYSTFTRHNGSWYSGYTISYYNVEVPPTQVSPAVCSEPQPRSTLQHTCNSSCCAGSSYSSHCSCSFCNNGQHRPETPPPPFEESWADTQTQSGVPGGAAAPQENSSKTDADAPPSLGPSQPPKTHWYHIPNVFRGFQDRRRRLPECTCRPREATQPISQATQPSQESHTAQATPARPPTPTSQPSQPAQTSPSTLPRKAGGPPAQSHDVDKTHVLDPDYPHLHNRAVPNARCRDALLGVERSYTEAYDSCTALRSKASKTTKRNIGRVLYALAPEAFGAIFDLATEEHWIDWVVCTYKAWAVDITKIAGTSADDDTIDRELESVMQNGCRILRQRLSTVPRTSGSTVPLGFGHVSIHRSLGAGV